MNKLRQIALAGILLFVVVTFFSCTTAGPYVTSISSDGRGNLIIEKNTVEHNPFMGTVSSGGTPTTQVIRICPDPEEK